MPLFSGIPLKLVYKIIPLLKKRYYNMGKYLYNEGEKASKIYFIKAGLVEISKFVPEDPFNDKIK